MTDLNSNRFDSFVNQFEKLLDSAGTDEARLLNEGRVLLRWLVACDEWLAPIYAIPSAEHYQQYLLYRCPAGRFSVVSFVWGPGQKTPIHNHTVWGLIGMLRGAEVGQRYEWNEAGELCQYGDCVYLAPGDVEMVSPTIGDIHRVANAFDDRVSVSIHVYGADIGAIRRHIFDPETGEKKEFISGYANQYPNPLPGE